MDTLMEAFQIGYGRGRVMVHNLLGQDNSKRVIVTAFAILEL